MLGEFPLREPSPMPANSSTLHAVQGTLREYGRALGVEVILHVPADGWSPPAGGPGLHFHPGALPVRPWLLGRWPKVPRTEVHAAFGLRLAAAKAASTDRPRWRRGEILRDASGTPVVELKGTNVYVLFDLLGEEPRLAALLARKALDLAIPRLRPRLSEASLMGRYRVASAADRLRRETAALELRRAPAPTESDSPGAMAVQACVRRLEEAEQALRCARARLRTLPSEARPEASFAAEFDRLVQLPGVRDVRVGEEGIEVFTEPITIDFEGRRHWVGRFRMDLYFDRDPRIWNLTHRYESYDHPHIDEGRPCLGNIQEWVGQLITGGQFAAASQVLLEFLRTVDPAGWRKSIKFWREVPA